MREAMMTIVQDQDRPAIATLAAVIAHSQIVVAKPHKPTTTRFPVGFDAVDVAILDWIAAEGRHAARSFGRM
jgi:hypothetical protein